MTSRPDLAWSSVYPVVWVDMGLFYRLQGTGNREQGTGNREQEIGSSCGSVQTAGLSTSLRFGRDDKFVGEAGRNMVFRVELL